MFTTLQASIAKAALDVAVAFRVPSSLPYVSMMLSAVNAVSAVVLATESLQQVCPQHSFPK